ncbi:MAG: cbb3-type cytochrome oxidase subunit 3 [Wenzhouxiangella sp.]
MSSGLWTAFAMLAFVGITIWVFFIKKKEDFDEQAHLPLDEEDRENKNTHKRKEGSS